MQQVNLYLDSLRPKKELLTLGQMLSALVLVVLILVVVSFLVQRSKVNVEHKLAAKQRMYNQLLNQEKTLEVRVKGLQIDESLQNLNKRLEKRIKLNDKLAKTIDSAIHVEQGQFSKLLLALSRQYLSGISLTHIKFDNGGNGITLEGNAVSADKVPEYLQRLRHETNFVGRSFRTFIVEGKPHSPFLAFYLSTDVVGQDQVSALNTPSMGANP
jgi:MSHA biogenesis protein MshI